MNWADDSYVSNFELPVSGKKFITKCVHTLHVDYLFSLDIYVWRKEFLRSGLIQADDPYVSHFEFILWGQQFLTK